jgi:hypothetical protein
LTSGHGPQTGPGASERALAGAVPTSDRRRRVGVSGWLVPTLDALIEGGWIAVVDAAFAAVSGSAALGPIPFAIAAAASLFWARNAADRSTALIGLAAIYVAAFVAAGLLGGQFWGVGAAGPERVVFAQGSAVFAALAVFRGSRHVEAADDDLVVGSLLQWGVPLLALPWLYASQLAVVHRDAFAATAFSATLVFAAAGLLALGLARLDSLATLSGVSWRTNRAWLVLLAGVLAVMVAIAVPSAFLLGTPLTALVAGLLGPMAIVLTPVAAVLGKLIELVFFLLTPLIDLIQSLIRRRDLTQEPTQIGPGGPLIPPIPDQGEPSALGLIVLAAITIAVAVLLFLLILRLTYRPRAVPAETSEGPLEEREFRFPTLTVHLPRLGRRGGRARPTTASGAYLAFLGDLDGSPGLARHPDEPPATHAARLRSAGFSDPRAALLSADYQLEHYALCPLTSRETARALRRQVRLHDSLRERPRPRASGGSDAGP